MDIVLTRSQAMETILGIMSIYKISLKDLTVARQQQEENARKKAVAMMNELQFDVAVMKSCAAERISLADAGHEEVIGIYPFKDGPYKDCYLELKEYLLDQNEAVWHANGRQNLPDPQFWQAVEPILLGLNEALKQLGASPVSGSYYIKSPEKKFWTISSNSTPNSPIKTRFVGRFGR